MKQAYRLARQGLFTTGINPRVGCVLVKSGAVVGEGFHARTGGPHAEVLAIAEAGDKARGSTAYVTLEPCAHQGRTGPCADALIDAGVNRVVVSITDPNPSVSGQGLDRLQHAGIEVDAGVLSARGESLNPGFLKRMRVGLPHVRIKLAQSLDGRTAMASGESQWITGAKARRDVQYWRARSQAIITGIETVLHDNCRLTARHEELAQKHISLIGNGPPIAPMRLILDTNLRTPLDANVLNGDSRCVIFAAQGSDTDQKRRLIERGAEIIEAQTTADGHIDLNKVLGWLSDQEVNEVLVEAGASLAGSFANSGLADQLIVYTAPVLMGSSARPLLSLPLSQMKQRLHLKNVKHKKFGKDWRLIADL